ncbi:MAG: hypothetical protein KJ077_51615 [Anaerolineae bacterium]|nr:hypothetical protein [Anaerolineae bacterium]
MSNMVKFLNYWWIADSEIDPLEVNEDYFKVYYDDQGRYKVVERYDKSHQLQSHDKFFWEGSFLTKVEVYTLNGELSKYIAYHYRKNGDLKERIHYSPTGKLLYREPADF